MGDERNKHMIHKDILVCEVCQKEATKYYTTGKVTGKSLCRSCYNHEYQKYQHDALESKDEREKYGKEEENNMLNSAQNAEITFKYLIPKMTENEIEDRNKQSNRLIDAEKSFNEKKITDKPEEKTLNEKIFYTKTK